MNIDSTSPIRGPEPVHNGRPAEHRQPLSNNEPNFQDSITLGNALQQTPEIRSDRVAKASEIVSAPDYPSRQVLASIGQLFAQHL